MRKSLPMLASMIALLVAVLGVTPLGEAAYEAVVPRSSVGTRQLQRNAVKAAKIAPDAVRTGHILNGSLLLEDFAPGQIAQGLKGDKGDNGAPGVSGYQIVNQAQTEENTGLYNMVITCPTGKMVFGGGATADAWLFGNGPYLVSSIPTPDGTGWSVRMSWHTAPSGAKVTGYAVCGAVS